MKRVLIILLNILKWIFVGLVGVLFLGLFLFRLPLMHEFTGKQVAAYLSGKTQLKVSIESIEVDKFIVLKIKNLNIKDNRDSAFIKWENFEVKIDLIKLLDDQLKVDYLVMDRLFFAMIQYKGEPKMNLDYLIDPFLSSDTTSSSSLSIKIILKDFKLNNSSVVFDLQEMEHFEGMDYVHLFTDSINIHITDFTIKGDTFLGNMEQFSVREKCGFEIQQFTGYTEVSSKEINIPNLILSANTSYAALQFKLKYERWPDWIDFIEKVQFETTADSVSLNMSDLKYFSTTLTSMSNRLIVKGVVTGNVSALKFKNGEIFFGDKTYYKGDMSMNGLPDFEQTFIRLKVKEARILPADIAQFSLPDGATVPMPDVVHKLGLIKVKGRFTGFYYDFVSNAQFETALGNATTDILLRPIFHGSNFEYSGHLATSNFDVGQLLGTSYLGAVSLEGNMKGQGLDADLVADYDINFSNLTVAGKQYDQMKIDGNIGNRKINTFLLSKYQDFVLKTDLIYDFSQKYQLINGKGYVHNADLNRFFSVGEDSLGILSANFDVSIEGSGLKDITGAILLDSMFYAINNQVYKSDTFNLISTREEGQGLITLKSQFVSGEMRGATSLYDLVNAFPLVASDLLPNFIKIELPNSEDYLSWRQQRIDSMAYLKWNFVTKKSKNLTELFVSDLSVAPNTKFSGDYQFATDQLNALLISDTLSYANNRFGQLIAKVNKDKDHYYLDMFSNQLVSSVGLPFDSLNIDFLAFQDSLNFEVQHGKLNQTFHKGNFIGKVEFPSLDVVAISLNEAQMFINDSLWKLKNAAKLRYKPNYFEVQNFDLVQDDNHFKINGISSDKETDTLKLGFDNFNVSFFNFVLNQYDTDLKGMITGKVSLMNLFNQPAIESDFVIDSFFFNQVFLHTADVQSSYLNDKEAFDVDVKISNPDRGFENLNLEGYFYPNKKEDQLEFTSNLKDFPLRVASPYLSSFSSNIEGKADGKVDIRGRIDQLILDGKLHTKVDDILIDYTQVHYNIDDYLIFEPDYFGFVNAQAKDRKGNSLQITAQIFHKYFDDFSLNIEVKPQNAELINTSSKDNELFYGKAAGNGSFSLKGTFDDLSMKMNISPTGESEMSIPISSQLNASQTDFLTFVNPDTTMDLVPLVEESVLKFDLDMQINVTPTTKVELVMDKTVGDVISARGAGNIKVVYDEDENLFIYGSYLIERGNYLFTMQNILSKKFTIAAGGSIVWDGPVEDAKINLSAVYKTDAKLWDLLQQIDSSSVYKKPSKVNCIINITGFLYNPTISFEIELPEESIATRELVNSLLSPEATGSTEELNKNFVSLLVLGRFQAPSGYQSGDNPDAITQNAYELLAGQVSNILNQMSDEVEIGFDWNPGDEITTQEVAVALSYSMLDDRLIIDGRFGTGGGSTTPGSETRIIGDLLVEYKLTDDGRLRAKVFNRTNYYDPVSRKAPYTQGVGLSVRKDFDTMKELFTPKDRKKEAKEKETKKKSQ